MKILIAVAVVVVVFIVVVATRPSAYHVERKLEIAAPPDVVFTVLNDVHQLGGVMVLFGEPFEKVDPAMKRTFEGPTSGVGQSYAWSSDKGVGTGKMTIEESVRAQKVRVRLDFVEPMTSTSIFSFNLAPSNGTLVTWAMDGNHNFIGKAFGLFVDMDKMLGADLEKSLAQLKIVAEGKRTTDETKPDAVAKTSAPTVPNTPTQ